ncbi:CoxG family protein [Nitrospirillum iridis]|uniref:Carbon monoxide dehydrogenase subunit G n=1 Tax=Nitrospirillum iridis TaxID=765888 RepID=A0A7X0AZB2_9PROT|nr:hypothetical protein [Nitrospirillum iridis]MBB6251319.1 hypothetical protein [Nitrospirillum iridis]
MDITGEYLIAAPRDRVWAALTDAEVLRQSVPADHNGTITLTVLDAPHACVLHGDGQQARVHLTDTGDGQTRLAFDATIDAEAEPDTRAFFAHLAGLLGDVGAPVPAVIADVALAEPAVDSTAIADVIGDTAMVGDAPTSASPPKRSRAKAKTATEMTAVAAEPSPKAKGTHRKAAQPPAPEAPPAPPESIPLVELSPVTEVIAPTLIPAAQDAAENEARAIEHQLRPTEAEALGSASVSLPPEPTPEGTPAPSLSPPPAHPGLRPMIWIPILVLILLLMIVLVR